jgi:hypothetical protein
MSCLFDSISAAMSGLPVQYSAVELRSMACAYLDHNGHRDITEGLVFRDAAETGAANYSDYVAEMQKEDTWGGAIEIAALIRILKVNIHVHCFSNVIEFNHSQESPTLIIYFTGNHYSPINRHTTH